MKSILDPNREDAFIPIARRDRWPDVDICCDCKEHAEFDEDGYSECCGAKPYDTDPDIDSER